MEILLVDDEMDYAETMAFWLKAKGHRVITVGSGEEAISLLEERRVSPTPQFPHIIFLDIMMPGMDGIETLRRIREIHPAVPVIMVTAYVSEERMQEARALGAFGFFHKEADFSNAARLIEQALQGMQREGN